MAQEDNKMQYAQMIWDYMKREDPLEKVSNCAVRDGEFGQ